MFQSAPSSLLGRLIRLPLHLIPKEVVMRVWRGPCKGMRWIVGSSIHGCWLGTYESRKQQIVQQYLKPGMTVFDIGANAGYYTLLFSRQVGENGQVFAFEPFPQNTHNLLRHLRMNGLGNATLITTAIADRNGISSFRIAPHNAMGALTTQETPLHVPTLTLDQFISEGRHPIPELIKMDVEGAEGQVLEGARSTLAARKTVWFIALHNPEAQRHCFDILVGYGYRLLDLDGNALQSHSVPLDEIIALPA